MIGGSACQTVPFLEGKTDTQLSMRAESMAPAASSSQESEMRDAIIAEPLSERSDAFVPVPPSSRDVNRRDKEQNDILNPTAALSAMMAKRALSLNEENTGDTDTTKDTPNPSVAAVLAQKSRGSQRPLSPNQSENQEGDTSMEKANPAATLDVVLAGKFGSPPCGDTVDPLDAADLPLKDDPKYQKYFKMRQMGLPDGAIRNAMQRDEVDASILDLDPEKSLALQTRCSGDSSETEVLIKDDPAFQKYLKMRKMGLPDGAIRNAMQRDGVDTSILDFDWDKSVKSQTAKINDAPDEIPIKNDPTFQKYFQMRKMGLPDGAIRNAMKRDGVDDCVLDMDSERSWQSQANEAKESDDDGVPLNDDPAFQKYFKMRKMGLPDGAIRNAMERDGVDSSIIDLDPDKSLQSQLGSKADENDVSLKDDPEWSKYFKMINMGLPLGAVKNAVQRDGKDPSVLDLDITKSLSSQTDNHRRQAPQRKTSKKVRRKKIFWNPLDSKQIKANSLWSHVKGRFHMNQLKYDEKEFEDLFTESADPADRKVVNQSKESRTKKSVQVIDGKRSMNGGIILARLKMDFSKLAEMVDQM